jgi:hypothetical protein
LWVGFSVAGNVARDEYSGALTEYLSADGENFPAGRKFEHIDRRGIAADYYAILSVSGPARGSGEGGSA